MKNLTLIVDIGNTTTIFGIFNGENLVNVLITYTHKNNLSEKEKSLRLFLLNNDYEIAKGMVFSVVPSHSEEIIRLVKNVTGQEITTFKYNEYKNFKTTVDNPNEVGADLIADIIGANKLYGSPNLIVDLGTVNKILYSSKDGVFEGCSFLPGFTASLTSFNEKAALLPDIKKFKKPSNLLGKNTEDAMMHGIYWSTVSFIKNEQSLYSKDVKLILTGGHCSLVESEIDNKIVDQFLTLKGMNFIFMEVSE